MKPYELRAKFSTRCTRCRKHISAGERIVRNPDGGKIFCTKTDTCGPQIMRAAGAADLAGSRYWDR
jgi:hypothetical protein